MRPGLDEPLQATAAVQELLAAISGQCGLRTVYTGGFRDLGKLQISTGNNNPVTPLFDPSISQLDKDKAFWLYVTRPDGTVVARQAFRMEIVSTTLAEWALGWILGIYLMRGELIVPTQLSPNENSVAYNLSGCLVYHGELWISPSIKRRYFVELFSKLGLILAHIKWNPDAIWALVGKSMATGGHMSRMGYPHLEPGFLNWEYIPECADKMEWLGVADRRALCRMVEQLSDHTTLMSTGQTSETTVTPL